MILSVKERMALMTVLPQESNFATLGIVEALRTHLSLTEKEHKELKIRETPSGDGRMFVEWDQDAASKADKEIPIGEVAMNLIVEELKKMNEDNKLNASIYTLYDKFVESRR